VDQAVQAADAESSVHLFADAAVESGEPVEVVVTPTGSHIQQHQHRKRKERYESCNSQSQERKVIRYVTFIVRDLSIYLTVFNVRTQHSNRHNPYIQLNDKPGQSQLQNHIWSSQ
jgi:hypothetical protein